MFFLIKGDIGVIIVYSFDIFFLIKGNIGTIILVLLGFLSK